MQKFVTTHGVIQAQFEKGDVVLVAVKVEDNHDRGNLVLSLDGHPFNASQQQLANAAASLPATAYNDLLSARRDAEHEAQKQRQDLSRKAKTADREAADKEAADKAAAEAAETT